MKTYRNVWAYDKMERSVFEVVVCNETKDNIYLVFGGSRLRLNKKKLETLTLIVRDTRDELEQAVTDYLENLYKRRLELYKDQKRFHEIELKKINQKIKDIEKEIKRVKEND